MEADESFKGKSGYCVERKGNRPWEERQHMPKTCTNQITNSEHRSWINPDLPSYKLLLHSHNIQHCRSSIC